MRRLSDIRTTFTEFFTRNGHTLVPSSPLIPRNDPTLLFTNAGMVQFKDVFTGKDKRPYQRATSAQKCVRAGGKHNDLENVGYTARHHTFFEMLGNFSFGDYFKEEAISLAWTLLTKDFGLSPEKLLVTVYHEDKEAASLWKKIAQLPDHKIIPIKTLDNFWSMGDTGPCGPCTEIFYDHGENIPGGPPGSPDEDGDRFVEIWNLVFMQFDQQPDGTRVPLPKPSVDTGMGLERMATVLQGVHNNFDTDLFQCLIEACQDLTQTKGAQGRQSHNVIADHLRASAFLLAEGILPSNEGRGYVLRRIMRRAMRHGHLLGAREPLLYRLVPLLIDLMGSAYPELTRSQALIAENLKLEEERFRETLERGLRLLEEETNKLSPQAPLPGHVAFKLYDTYGFPLDLTQDVLRQQDRQVDLVNFEASMAQQKEKARAAWKGSGETKNTQLWYDLQEECGSTEFLGYDANEGEALLQALLQGETRLSSTQGSQVSGPFYVLTNQTPFYGESGGQEGDHGWITSSTGRGKVFNTLKMLGSLHVHEVHVEEGYFQEGQAVHLAISIDRRQGLRRHHSATHLLHGALRHILGTHVTQKGSLVAEDRLRFDFTHTKSLTPDQLYQVEDAVNDQIHLNILVETHLMGTEEALEKGAMALFGEKYGDQVRVLTMGRHKDQTPFSVELCGGTHVSQTGEIGLFKIISEVGISAGVRRIEALTGKAALRYVRELQTHLQDALGLLKCTPSDMQEKLQALLQERRTLEKQLVDLRQQQALQGGENNSQKISPKKVGSISILFREFQDLAPRDLKPMADQLKTTLGSGIVVLTSAADNKVSLVVAVTEDLLPKISAVELVQRGVLSLGGKGGGGRPDMAQGGGTDANKIPQAFQDIEAYLAQQG